MVGLAIVIIWLMLGDKKYRLGKFDDKIMDFGQTRLDDKDLIRLINIFTNRFFHHSIFSPLDVVEVDVLVVDVIELDVLGAHKWHHSLTGIR